MKFRSSKITGKCFFITAAVDNAIQRYDFALNFGTNSLNYRFFSHAKARSLCTSTLTASAHSYIVKVYQPSL